MKKIRLYFPEAYQPGATIELTGDAFQHGVKVLRCRLGDMLELFDGNGKTAMVELIAIQRRHANVVVVEVTSINRESPLNTLLVQSVSKGERMDWVLQKATELGVSVIQPVLSERCNVQLDKSRWTKRWQHWQRVIISACEQSGRNHLPQLKPVMELSQFISQTPTKQLFVLQPELGIRFTKLKIKPKYPIGFLIGPEGGFTDKEVDSCIAAGIKGVTLGPRILRTETAGISILAIAQSHWGDF